MEIIPAINVDTFEEIEQRLAALASAFSGVLQKPNWVQIDVADGSFTTDTRWHDPHDIPGFDTSFAIELHLMLDEIDEKIDQWTNPLIGRIIFHVEAAAQPSEVIEKIKNKGIQVGLALKPGGRAEEFEPYLDNIDLVQFLAVTPGKSGAKMEDGVLDQISDFSVRYPEVTIQIDGGITKDNIDEAHAAGASLIVAGSAIFGGEDIQASYQELFKKISDLHR